MIRVPGGCQTGRCLNHTKLKKTPAAIAKNNLACKMSKNRLQLLHANTFSLLKGEIGSGLKDRGTVEWRINLFPDVNSKNDDETCARVRPSAAQLELQQRRASSKNVGLFSVTHS